MALTKLLNHRRGWIQVTATLCLSAIPNLLVAWFLGTDFRIIAPFLVLNAGLLLGLGLYSRWRHRRSIEGWLGIEFEQPARPARALVVLVSAGGGSATALAAARHHSSSLRHLWLVHTPESSPQADEVANAIRVELPEVIVDRWPVHASHRVKEVKAAIEQLQQRLLLNRDISETDIVFDFTGLTKHASAGMVLACGPRKWRLEYVVSTAKDERGRGTEAGAPIEVDVAFAVEPEGDGWAG